MMVRREADTASARFAAQSRVVVGASDSTAGQAALNVAVDIAVRRQLPLHLVRVWRDVDWFLPGEPDAMDVLVADELGERDAFAKICKHATDRAPRLRLSWELVAGDVYASLLELTTDADLLVLGTSPAEGRDNAGLSDWFIEHSRCPVIVVDAAERIVEYRAAGTVAHAAAQ